MPQDVSFFAERFDQLRQERAPFENQWRQIAKHYRPMREEFRSFVFTGEQPPTSDPYITDSSSFMAVDNFVGGVYTFMSNPANRWLALKTFDDDLNEFHSAKEWLYTVSSIVLRSYAPAVASFYNEVPELYADTPSFGIGAFFSEYRPEQQRFFDKAFSPFDVLVDVNDFGEIDTVYRPFQFTARQAEMKFGEGALSQKLQGKLKRSSNDRYTFIHVIYPNTDRVPGKLGVEGFPMIELYFELDTKHPVKIAGRDAMPYQTPRWSGTQKYGYGLGRRNLADAKTINAMDNAFLEATEWQAKPSVLAANEDALETLRPVPRGVSYGAISRQGRPLVQFVSPEGNLAITSEALEARREQHRQAWFFGLMQLVGRSGLTEMEVLEFQEERMRMFGPNLGRQQIEFLSPSVARRVQMLNKHGQIPPPPPELEGEPLQTVYESPMARAQMASDAQSTLRFVSSLGLISELDPAAADLLNGEEAGRVLHEGSAAPATVLNSPEEVEAKRQARAQAQQAQQALQLGQQGADIANTLGVTPGQQGEAANAG